MAIFQTIYDKIYTYYLQKSSFISIEWKSLEYSDEGEADAHMLFLLHHDLVRMNYDDNGFRIYESKGKTDIGDLICNYGVGSIFPKKQL